MVLVGHVTKEGALAGPRVLEHAVDCVLQFEGDRERAYRALRSLKNRFGSTNEMAVFEMYAGGLREVGDPSARFAREAAGAAGSCVLCAMEGTRPLLVEVQALVAPTEMVPPRRVANGIDRNRLSLVLAVLSRHVGRPRRRSPLGSRDVFVSVAGGLRVEEPGADLAVALAVASASKGIVPADGEGPARLLRRDRPHGRARYVAHAERRMEEAARFGLERLLLPSACIEGDGLARGWLPASCLLDGLTWHSPQCSAALRGARGGAGRRSARRLRAAGHAPDFPRNGGPRRSRDFPIIPSCRELEKSYSELQSRQEPRLLRALEMVSPGTALREGIDNIVLARTGGLIVVGEEDEIAPLLSGGIKLDIEYSPAILYQLAKMDGAITLSQNATKILWANMQLTPDPTILSRETGTRHRTAERVCKQTSALVVSVSERREVVSLFADGAKYILQEIPAVLAKANQALATLDKYRARFDQVSMRLTALEFEGGVTLHDALTVLQRAEMVTRMGVEIERYIVELGAEGRLIEAQLEDMLVGVGADRSASSTTTWWASRRRASRSWTRCQGCRTRTCWTSDGWRVAGLRPQG